MTNELFQPCICSEVRELLYKLRKELERIEDYTSLVLNDVAVKKHWPKIECRRCGDTAKYPTQQGLELIEWLRKNEKVKADGMEVIPF